MKLLALFQSYKLALVRGTVQTPAGDLSAGTAFRIGDGWLVTAAHVFKDGLSGGPVLSEYGFLLGVLTESLEMNDKDAETGYSSAISTEPPQVMLYDKGIYPGKCRQIMEALLDGVDDDFAMPSRSGRWTQLIQASMKKLRTHLRQPRGM